MLRYDRRVRALAMGLSALAGYVDAIGFIKLGGFFVSFMSGNSTRLAVGLAQGSTAGWIAAELIFTFVLGVVGGSLTGAIAGQRRRPAVLALVASLLAAAAGFGALGMPGMAVAAMAFAMGAENAVFEHEGEVRIGLTYMTGTLVKGGHRIAAALLGGARWDWVPYLVQWIGLVAGAVGGALVYPYLGLGALWIAAIAMGATAAIATRMEPLG
jgi:uncharacterized membrane protein YoaK (UPF0700 family)